MLAIQVALVEAAGCDMIFDEKASGGWIDGDGTGCCDLLPPLQTEERLVDDSIVIDEGLHDSIVETEADVKKRLGKLRSRLDTVTIGFDFSPFIGEAERYANALAVLRERQAIGRDDPDLAIVLDSKPLGRQASNAASYLMTHATELESRTRHDILSYLWLVNLAHEFSQTLPTKLERQTKPSTGSNRFKDSGS